MSINERKSRQAISVTKAATGAAIDFDIPQWATKITAKLSAVSTTGTSYLYLRLRTGGVVQAVDYKGSTPRAGASSIATEFFNVGFLWGNGGDAAKQHHGNITLTKSSGDLWVASGMIGLAGNASFNFFSGSKDLGGPLDGIQFGTANGTDQYDLGTITVTYEA
jgi:hypothetical protein